MQCNFKDPIYVFYTSITPANHTHKVGKMRMPVGQQAFTSLSLYSIYTIGSTPVYYKTADKARILIGCLIICALIDVWF